MEIQLLDEINEKRKVKRDIYREKLIPVVDDFKKRISDNEKKEIVISLRDIRKILGEGFETYDDKSDNGVYSRIKDILLEFGIKVELYHHFGANLKMTLAEESEIMSTAEIRRQRADKTAENAGFLRYADYKKYTPYYRNKVLKLGYMEEAIDCPLYLSYIKNKYIKELLPDVIPNPVPLGPYAKRGWDWMCKNGIKIKELNSCLGIRSDVNWNSGTTSERLVFQWNINKNNEADIFVLSGFKDRESLELMKTWVFYKYEVINGREFWNRMSFLISNHPRSIEKYSKYEISKEKIDKIIESLERREKSSNIPKSDIVDDEDILILPIDFKNKEKKAKK